MIIIGILIALIAMMIIVLAYACLVVASEADGQDS